MGNDSVGVVSTWTFIHFVIVPISTFSTAALPKEGLLPNCPKEPIFRHLQQHEMEIRA
jgi:hypothetical protein